MTNELSSKLLGIINSLLKSVETINGSMSDTLRLHVEVSHSLAASKIQIQSELRSAMFIGFKYVLGSEWQLNRNIELKFELVGP